MIGSIFCGDISEDGVIRLLGLVPSEASNGYNIRAIRLHVSTDLAGGQDFWSLRLGTIEGTTFTAQAEVDLSGGIKGLRRWTFARDLRVPRGSTVALKAVKHGGPAAITGLSVILEYGILGARS